MSFIERLKEWFYGPVEYAKKNSNGKTGYCIKGKEIKPYWVYGLDICPKNDYKNHIKGDTCILFGYCMNIFTGEIDSLYHCKYCQEVMHFTLDKNPKEKELYYKRKIETKNFKNSIKIK